MPSRSTRFERNFDLKVEFFLISNPVNPVNPVQVFSNCFRTPNTISFFKVIRLIRFWIETDVPALI